MLRVAVLCSGGGTNLQALIDAEKAGELGAEIALVIASKPKAYALERARNAGLAAVCAPKRDYGAPGEYEDALIKIINDNDVGLIVLAGFMVILDERFVRAFPGRIINIHPSLLPDFGGRGFYGLRVHEAVLASGARRTGATTHYVTEDVDGGPVIMQKSVQVMDGDTPEVLQKRVMEEAEWVILPQTVRLIAREREAGEVGGVFS